MAFGLSAGAATLIGTVAAPVISGMISGGGAQNAAQTQSGATGQANQISQQQYEQTRADLAPYRNYGSSATERLMQLLGLGPTTTQGSSGFTPLTAAQFYATKQPYDDAVQAQQAYDNYLVNNPARSASAGGQAVDGYGSLLKPFTGADLENEPGYKFGLTQGQLALDNKAAAGGRYFSGAALKGATEYAQDYAGTKYGEAFNRDASTKRQTYDFLNGGVTSGQNASAQTGSAGATMAGTVGANTTALGNAVGASQIAQGNALSNGLTGAANSYQQNQLTQAILGGNKGFGSGRPILDPYPYG